MFMMSAAWGALALVLSALGAAYGWFAWRSQGARGLVVGAGLVLLPIGLWLTGTLRLVGLLVDFVAGWATGLAFSPAVMIGTVLLVLAVVLLGGARRIAPRGERSRGSGEVARSRGATPAVGDDDLADIEALLRRRGIG